MKLFVDLDGTLSDFDARYKAVFGVETSKELDDADWEMVRGVKDFYLNIPPLPDMPILWKFIEPFKPIVLTGVPPDVEEASDNKRGWVRKHIGDHVEVRCCLSREKYLHCLPGDILIDDWEKYRPLWEKAGGIWITHVDAKTTIEQLRSYTKKGVNYGQHL